MGRRLALERAPPASVSPDLTAPGGGGPGASRGAALPLPTSPQASAGGIVGSSQRTVFLAGSKVTQFYDSPCH